MQTIQALSNQDPSYGAYVTVSEKPIMETLAEFVSYVGTMLLDGVTNGHIKKFEAIAKQDAPDDPLSRGWTVGVKVTVDEERGGWISVKDRLPEDTGEVEDYLVVVQDWAHDKSSYQIAIDFAYYPGNYIDGIWDTRNDWDEGNEVHVTHWMPLPKPPKEEDHAE